MQFIFNCLQTPWNCNGIFKTPGFGICLSDLCVAPGMVPANDTTLHSFMTSWSINPGCYQLLSNVVISFTLWEMLPAKMYSRSEW